MAGIFIACPMVAILCAIDSYFYGNFVFIPYNFYLINIVKKASEDFGVSPFYYYISDAMPDAFNLLYLVFWLSLFFSLLSAINKKVFPYLPILILTFIVTFSYIPHKEERFLLPIYPFCFLLMGKLINKTFKKCNKYE